MDQGHLQDGGMSELSRKKKRGYSLFSLRIFGRYVRRMSPFRGTKNTWRSLGPGLVTGAADDDPSGIATYSQAGAYYGFSLLWLSAYTFPLLGMIQEMCARIALITRKGLADNIKKHYSKKILVFTVLLLSVANIVNIGADLSAMAASARLLLPGVSQIAFVIAFGMLILAMEIYFSYKTYAKHLKWLSLIILSYVATAVVAKIPWKEALTNTFIPHIRFTEESLILITGVLGTTISPYLFFWQSSQEVEEEAGHTHINPDPIEVKKMRIDVWVGMLLSNIVMFAIVAVAGAVLHRNGITTIVSADQAASALRPLAGELSYILFALGIIGTGMLAVPVLAASMSYALAETFGWNSGLDKKLGKARGFYGSIILAVLAGIGMNFLGIDPIHGLIAASVLNGLIAPVMLFFVMRIASSSSILGTYRNSAFQTLIGWFLVFAMSVTAVATIISLF